MRGKIVCALFAVGCCAFGQGLTHAIPEAARQACAKIPEEHREAVGSEIGKMAYTEATREAGEKFGLLIVPKDWTNTCGKGVLLGSYMALGPYRNYYKYAPDGRLVQYGNRTNFEELVWCDRRRDELVVQFWNDRAVVDAALSNAVASAEKTAENRARGARPGIVRRPSSSSFGRRLNARPQQGQGLLEELVPLEEAMALAKAGKGKGFYQLALRYARGEGLPQDNATAYRMLCKARDADYAHAVLVEGLCDEKRLHGGRGYSRFSQEWVLHSYCGADFTDGRDWGDHDSLTNAVAVARVMGKYEKAKRLGALVATNQIAALNKRLSDFKAEEAKRLQAEMQAEANNRRVAEFLTEVRAATAARERAEAERKRAEAAARERAERERVAMEAAAQRERVAAERERAAAEREQQRQQLQEIQEKLRRQREQRQREVEMQTAGSVVPVRSSLANLRARRAQMEEEAKRKVRDERMALLPKYRAAFKALTGYEMGQKIDEEVLGREREWKNVKLAKPYRYFTDCTLEVCDGCLYGVSMSFGSDGKYSRKSLEAEAEAVRKDLARRFGVEEEEILERTSPVLRRAGLRRAGWSLAVSVGIEGGIWLSISDDVLEGELRTRLKEKREAQKEVLPVFEEAGKK